MNLKKSISLVLTLCMVFSLFATFVFPVAAEGTTYTLIDTVEDLTAGTYYMGGVVTNDGYGPYQIFSGSVGTSSGKTDLTTSLYTYTDGVLATDSAYPAAAVVLAAVEGKENTYTIYVDGKGYITCTDYSANRRLNYADTACEWVVSNNANGGITFSSSSGDATTYMGINQGSSSSPTQSKFIRNYNNESTLTSGLVFFAEDVEEAPVTSNVVTDWNVADWNGTELGASAAIIFTDGAAYLATTGYSWWSHVSFKPTDEAGVYEVVNRRGATGEAPTYEIVEGGFVWMAHDTAAEGTPGKYAHTIIQTLNAGDKVVFTGLDIANKTTTADATAEKVVPPEEIFDAPEFAGENVALNKTYTYPTENLYYHWSDEWPCTDNVATALTDGVRVAGYYGKGETSGWGGATPRFVDIVIDLEAVYDISGFAYVLTGGADGIAHPETVEISVSTDGVTYVPVSVETVSGNKYFGESWSPCYDLDYYATPAAATAGRYVKFVFHKVEGTNFIFVNELEVWGTEAVVEEDDDSFKDTYTHVDGETVGTTQSRGEGWESLLVPDFWYVVEDGATEVTIKVAVDNRVVAADDTMLRVWIDADPSDTARTTLVDTKVADGAAYVARVDGGFDAAILSQTYSVIGNDYYLTVVLDKAALGIDGQYGLMLTLSETGYNSMHNVAWDVEDVAGAAPWNTTKDYILYGEEPEVEYNEKVVDVTENAVLTDGLTGFDGNWGTVGATDVLLIQNDKCTTNPMKVIVNYALGETKTIDALVLDFYHCAGVMIGYPEGKVLVEYSVDGVEYTALGEYDLAAAEVAVGSYGTVSSTLAFDAVDAAYVRATFVVGSSTGVLGDSPADGKVFWEFASLAEVAVNEVPAAPEYNTGWNVEYDDTQIKILSGNEAFVAALTDSVWAEGATSFGTTGVLLVQNLVCTNPELYPELTLVYNAGTAIDVNNIKVGLYVETNSMIGYPSKDAKVYVSTDGIEWTPVDSTTDIPESVFVQHGNSENSLGTYVANIEFATSTAQYVKVVFTYTDSPFNDPDGDYKPVYEFIGFTEAEVSYVEPSAELPEDATGLDVYGYTHTFLNYVMYVDTDMTLGELTAKYYGSSKDLNYFKVIVVNADGTVAATYLELDRNTNPASVKTDIAVTAGQYVLALSANEANVGRHEIADTVNVGDIVTLYNVDFTAEPGELTNAGFTVKAAASGDLNEVDGGDLPAFNPMLGQNVAIPANTALSYTVAFEDGAFFALYDENVKVLVNGEAVDGEANLVKGDVVTLINASAEEYVAYPRCVPVIKGTMSNPFIIDVLGDITANVTEDIAMDSGAAFYTYTATADGKIVFTMLTETNWTYTVNNITAGIYGDTQWSDSDPVLKTWTVDVKAGDEVQISVAPYNPDDPWAVPTGEIKFNVRFLEKYDIVDLKVSHNNLYNWGTYESMIISQPGKTVTDVISQTPYWWIMYVVENVDGVYVATAFYKNCDEINTTVCPDDGFLYYVYSSNSAWAVADEGMLLGYIFNLNDIDLSANFAIDTTANDPKIMTAINPDALKVGDVNMNGKIDANDYATIRKLVVGSLTEEDLSAKALELADVNGNGKIDANDYILVKRHVLGTYTIPAWEDVE